MNLIIKSPNNFEIIDGKLKSESKFEVEKQGNNLIIQGRENQNVFMNGNNISFSGNSISMLKGSSTIGMCGDFRDIQISQKNISFNGYTFNFKNGELYINGIKFVEDKTKAENEKENEYLEYPLEIQSINAISISSSARLTIKDLSILSDEDLSIALQGSGKVVTNNSGYFIKSLTCSVQGSGDIQINKFQADSCNCSLQGSGNIILMDSNFNNLNLNVMGSGNITGRNTTAERSSKNVMGSGGINGF